MRPLSPQFEVYLWTFDIRLKEAASELRAFLAHANLQEFGDGRLLQANASKYALARPTPNSQTSRQRRAQPSPAVVRPFPRDPTKLAGAGERSGRVAGDIGGADEGHSRDEHHDD